jgi:cytochrome c-type biogenesis protein CcmF
MDLTLGKILIISAFIMASFSLLLRLAAFFLPSWRGIGIARKTLYLSSGLVVASSILFLYLILSHRFDVAYVYHNTSMDLPLLYLISSFWAGQEGSLLLFALFLSIIGPILDRRAGEENHFVGFFNALPIVAILSLLTPMNPFTSLAQELGGKLDGIPMDGEGLNPLLLNFWMAIHPPFLFLGYSLLLVPFSLIIGGICGKGWTGWERRTMPWAISGWTILWIGIATGGYWAYKTLGWGGYWAWDPVENISLVVWLLSSALIHGLIKQMAGRGMERTNAFLSILIAISIFFGNYITRSGVLGDISVHSFLEVGKAFNLLLIAWTIVVSGSGLIALSVKWGSYRGSEELEEGWGSRSPYFPIGVWITVASAVIIAFGTVYPLISRAGGEKVLSMDFFNAACLPAAIAISILSGIASVLPWGKGGKGGLVRLAISGILSLGSIPILLFWVHNVSWIVLLASLILCISANIASIYSAISRGMGLIRIGGYLSHIGISAILVGAIASYGYEKREVASLTVDRPVHVMGYEVRYNGMERAGWGMEITGKGMRRRVYLEVRSTRKGSATIPAVFSSILRDLYISPRDFIPDSSALSLYLRKGEEKGIRGYRIRFMGFEIIGATGSRGAEVRARLRVRGPKGSVVEVAPGMDFSGTPTGRARLPEGEASAELAAIRADEGMIALRIYGLDGRRPSEALIVEISEKPLVSMVHLGAALIMLGGILAFIRRTR